MQTDIFLQKALVNEVKDVLKGYTTLNNGEPVKFTLTIAPTARRLAYVTHVLALATKTLANPRGRLFH